MKGSDYIMENSEKKKVNWLKEIWEWVYTIAIAIAIALLIKNFLFDIVKVDGSSMYPTLIDGDRLIVSRLGYEPEYGDIVILDSTYKDRQQYYKSVAEGDGKEELGFIGKLTAKLPQHLKKRYYVKRVIGMPGQTVDLRDGKVYIDDVLLDEEYYDGVTYPIDSNMQFPITVEEDTVFVMGDNRPRSKDSRSADLGLVPYEALLGQSQFRIWPLNAVGVTR